jgi:hypothetical protein
MIVSSRPLPGDTIEMEGERMSKIWVNFNEGYNFVLFDSKQGILRRKKSSSGEQIPIEILETEFVKGKISEGLLTKVDSPKKIKEK